MTIISKFKYVFFIFPPIIASILSFGIGLGNGWLQGDTGSPWCDFGPYNWGMVTVVYFCLSVFCLMFFSCILIKLLLKNRQVLLKNKYLLMFLSLFLWVFGFASFVGLYYNIHVDEYTESFTNWVLCNARMEEGCYNKSSIPMWMIYIDYVNYTSTGVYAIFILGFQPKVLDHWREMFRQLRKGNYKALWNLSGTRSKVTKSSPAVTGIGGSSSQSINSVKDSRSSSSSNLQ
eukprot:TRINITY_DN2442_c0_g1_i2.p2 TRINITY_DN2442_c0_g1~~TRINITY_DN2442_c0_g1_i2.p2  ORF type:complete len:232 (+),score=38.07 TRINITY_DN2442_c0_g1_i2:1229-1924(+)